jgi:cystathionine gamma-synthase
MMENELKELHLDSKVIAAGRPPRAPDASLNPPIILSSTFHAGGNIGYGRFGNESWTSLEETIAILEGAPTLTFASGMAAVSAALSILSKDSIVVTSKNGYTGSMKVLSLLEESNIIQVRYVDVSDTDEVLLALFGATMLWIESPTNPALEVADLPLIIQEAKNYKVIVAVDNTFSTALIQKPIELGADISMNSVTKYLAGHSDVLIGSLSISNVDIYNKISNHRKFAGAIPGPFESWLALRGIRTLSVRLERAQSNAMELANRLLKHEAIERVRYPGLPTDPHHMKAKSFMKGFGAIISIEVKGGVLAADKACESSKLITYATSLGGVESLWERRHRWSSESPTIPTNLIRISVGIENIEDLWTDINQALVNSQQL